MIKQAGAWALGSMVLAFPGAGCRPGSTPPASPPALHDDVLIARLKELELEPRLARRTASPDPAQNPPAATAGTSATVQCRFAGVRLDAGRNTPSGQRAAAQAAARESLERRRNVEQDYLAGLRSRFPARYNTNAIEAASSAWLHRAKAPEPPAPRIGGAQ